MRRIFKGAVIILALMQLGFIAGCASKSSASQNNTQAASNAPSSSYGALSGSATFSTDTANTNSGKAPESTSSSSSTVQLASTRKIITSASISLQTTAYDKSVSDLENLVQQFGGFVQDSTVQGTGLSNNDSRTATYTLRIPSDKLNDFLTGLGGIGKLVSKSVTGDDVTQDYMDTQTRVNVLKSEQTQILDILAKTQDITDVLKIEDELTSIEQQIEQLTGELQQWDSLVDLSTVTVNIQEVKSTVEISSPTSSFGEKLVSILQGSFSALVVTLEWILYIIIGVLPFAIIFGIVVAIVMFIKKRSKKKNGKLKDKVKVKESGSDIKDDETPIS